MKRQLDTLLNRIRHLPDRGDDVTSAVAAYAKSDELPPPQVTWTLFALVHYRQRQRWAWKAIQPLLQAARQAEQRRENEPPLLFFKGPTLVPGLPDWEFEGGEYTSALVHRATRERINLQPHAGPEMLTFEVFLEHLNTCRSPGLPEQRLIELFADWRDAVNVPFRLLRRAGLVRFVGNLEYTLSKMLDAYVEAVEGFLTSWSIAVNRIWLGALIGDWSACHQQALASGQVELAALAAKRSEDCRRRWVRWLRKWARRKERGRPHYYPRMFINLLFALAAAGDEDIGQFLEPAFR